MLLRHQPGEQVRTAVAVVDPLVVERAGPLEGEIPLENIATVRAVRRLRSERLAILLENRSMLVVQPLWRHRLRELQAAFESATTSD